MCIRVVTDHLSLNFKRFHHRMLRQISFVYVITSFPFVQTSEVLETSDVVSYSPFTASVQHTHIFHHFNVLVFDLIPSTQHITEVMQPLALK